MEQLAAKMGIRVPPHSQDTLPASAASSCSIQAPRGSNHETTFDGNGILGEATSEGIGCSPSSPDCSPHPFAVNGLLAGAPFGLEEETEKVGNFVDALRLGDRPLKVTKESDRRCRLSSPGLNSADFSKHALAGDLRQLQDHMNMVMTRVLEGLDARCAHVEAVLHQHTEPQDRSAHVLSDASSQLTQEEGRVAASEVLRPVRLATSELVSDRMPGLQHEAEATSSGLPALRGSKHLEHRSMVSMTSLS